MIILFKQLKSAVKAKAGGLGFLESVMQNSSFLFDVLSSFCILMLHQLCCHLSFETCDIFQISFLTLVTCIHSFPTFTFSCVQILHWVQFVHVLLLSGCLNQFPLGSQIFVTFSTVKVDGKKTKKEKRKKNTTVSTEVLLPDAQYLMKKDWQTNDSFINMTRETLLVTTNYEKLEAIAFVWQGQLMMCFS